MMESKRDTSPFPHRPWGQRLTRNATSSTVQTMFNRELGFPGSSKTTDNFANKQIKRPILRQLIFERLPSLSEEPVDPILIKLEDEGVGNAAVNRKHIPNAWIKIVTKRSETILLLGDYLLKSMPKENNFEGDSRNLEYSNSFYKLQNDISLGFKRFSCADSRGFVQKGDFINFQYLDDKAHGLIYATLTAKGLIRFYDITHHNKLKSARILNLPLDENLRCTDIYVDYDHSNLYVLATLNGSVRQIFKISYPSLEVNSKMLTIDHSKFGNTVKMKIEQSVALVTTSSKAFLGNIEDYFRPDQPDVLEIPVFPIIASIKTTEHYFTMMDTVWPISITMSNPKKPTYKLHFRSMHDGREIWTKSFDRYDECILMPVLTDFSLMLHKYNGTYSIINIKKDSSYPPIYQAIEDTEHEFLKTSLETNPLSFRFSTRPMRKCVRKKIENDQRTLNKRRKFIAVDYCDTLELIGVCILDEGVIVVSLYDARTHQLFKRLPSLKIQDYRIKRFDSTEDDVIVFREKTIDFELHPDFIFITIEYSITKEYYCLNLLGEETAVTL